ncbi:transglutaminase family protein [Niveibacterium sp. SC-1]|uniref:transglutaminase family protein n=1 Tax=Niveibacterium sp. SC-1 TaxID=3135646 RepID=UPI00311FD4B6
MSPHRYFVSHLTEYDYRGPVALARHSLHLTPRALPWQQVESHEIRVSPQGAQRHRDEDAFGNPVEHLTISQAHDRLSVLAESWLSISARPPVSESDSPAWESVREALVFRAGRPPHPAELEASQFLFESRHVRLKRELAHWAAASFDPDQPLLAGVRALSERIHAEFEFDSDATHVATPVREVLETGRGVCQDFAHLMLSGLRSLGLAARYMSGYLLTTPPPGQPRLLGADASHAWVAVWCPVHGWVEYDPTNGICAGEGHITLGWGRDFADVTPLRGVLHGGGGHEPEIEVSVVPEAEYEALMQPATEAVAETGAETATTDPEPARQD